MTWKDEKNYRDTDCCGTCKYSTGIYTGNKTCCTFENRNCKVFIDWICDDWQDFWGEE